MTRGVFLPILLLAVWGGCSSAAEVFRYNPALVSNSSGDSQGFDFVVYGDTEKRLEEHKKLVDAILAVNPELVLNTGDLVSRGDSKRLWDEFWGIIGELANEIPYYTVRGNHDTGRKNYYQERFAPPNNSGTDLYYSFDHKNAHFIALDTNIPYERESPQHDWLVKDLSSTKAQYVFVFFHHPLFSIRKRRSNNEKLITAFHELFVKRGVRAVFCGHDHLYYRTIRDGVAYITTAAGGSKLADVDLDLPHLEDDVWGKFHHFILMTVSGSVVKGKVIDIEGEMQDAFTVS